MRRNSILYVAAIIIILGCSNSKQSKPDRLSKASRENKNGWIYDILKAPRLISGISMVTYWRMTLIQAFNPLRTFFSMTPTGIGTFTAAQRKIFYGINLI